VIERAFANHVEKIIITGTTLQDSKEILEESMKDDRLFVTVRHFKTNFKTVFFLKTILF